MLLHPSDEQQRRDSFRSYVAAYDSHVEVKDINETPNFILLNGEIVSSQCNDVLLYPPFQDNYFGKLYCTNFRICFIPLAQKQPDPCCSRSVIFADEHQVPLCSIASIYYSPSPIVGHSSASPKKYRLMTAPASQLDIISSVKIYTKDFRVWTFDLQRSQFAVNLANNIYHFSRPSSLSNLLQLSCEGFRKTPQPAHNALLYNNGNDWRKELLRCGDSETRWRICFLKSEISQQKAVVPSYPFCVVVPSDLFDVTVYENLIPNWCNGRFPVWCWSSSNGSALLRSSACNKDLNAQELWKKVLWPICQAHPHRRPPQVIDCDISAVRISSSFEKLRELCSLDSKERFTEKEKEWYTLVDDTGWCALVFRCLQLSSKVIHRLIDNQRSVVVTDGDGFNASAVVSSLVQVCTDRFYRTITGFSALIEKEWIALGHPFGLNMFGCTLIANIPHSRPKACTATFLLFLDCVAQLIRLHPLSFEYSHYLLIALWDLSITGLASGLTCNSVNDRLALCKTAPTFPLSQYYTSKYCLMFTNVLYSANLLLGFESVPVIRPSSSPIDVQFWNECYLRWMQPANIADGGILTKDVALSSILSSAASVAYPECNAVVWRQRLHPALEASSISSSYPYSDALPKNTPALSEVSIISDTASTKSLRLQLERTSISLNPGSVKVGKERRFSTTSLMTRVDRLVESSMLRSSSSRPQHHSPPGTLV
ncbi:Myotubularin-like phosphatase domain family protein [Brugia pahangi]